MRKDNIFLEEERLKDVSSMDDYSAFHERHRIFPDVFEGRNHGRVLDIAAGVGIVGKRIRDNYPAEMICNDVSPTCLQCMHEEGLDTVSFDIDGEGPYPFPDGHLDAVVSLATIEHVINTDFFLEEIWRILGPDGYLYISAPNYSGIPYLLPFLATGRTFHDPLTEPSRYEFFAHVRYFTYRTLVEYISSFGFVPDSVYLPIPYASSRYLKLKERSRIKAFGFRQTMKVMYRLLSPRWASEPVVCFGKKGKKSERIRKVVL